MRYGMIYDRDFWTTFVYTGLQIYTKRIHAGINKSIHTGIHRFTQCIIPVYTGTYTGVYWCIPVYTGVSLCIPAYIKVYLCIPAYIKVYLCIPAYTGVN